MEILYKIICLLWTEVGRKAGVENNLFELKKAASKVRNEFGEQYGEDSKEYQFVDAVTQAITHYYDRLYIEQHPEARRVREELRNQNVFAIK